MSPEEEAYEERASQVGQSIAKFINDLKSDFENDRRPATKRDIAAIHVALLSAFEAIHEANMEASFPRGSALREKVTKRYIDAMNRYIDNVKTAIRDLIRENDDD